ncbi:AAA family ATPase [Nostoc parmelioides]|uniref:ATP-binding protein n=1 Tax=Nostoc parmelioides FACHB-3921 TaxID=2692909 RepID=A0ABR8BDQ5_9NOSO|nr:ATP-binding protein [Nostoc parmelioides]MBD2251991.1 ATP-binding protein [Nostoc parmelioides FACHB-3921]
MPDANSITNQLNICFLRLDNLLADALVKAEATHSGTGHLYISLETVEHLLDRPPGSPHLWIPQTNDFSLLLPAFADSFQLSPVELDIFLIALAPEFDRRYEQIYGYLHDDITQKRPTVDLVLNLLCPNAEAKLALRAALAPHAPLIRQHLLHLIPDPKSVEPTLLTHSLKVDDQIVRFCLGQLHLDPRLANIGEIVSPTQALSDLAVASEIKQTLHSAQLQPAPNFYLYGSPDLCKQAAAAIAHELKRSLLVIKLQYLQEQKLELQQIFALALREAHFHQALSYFDGVDTLGQTADTYQVYQLLRSLQNLPPFFTNHQSDRPPILFAGRESWQPASTGKLGAIVVPIPIPDTAQRQSIWQQALRNTNNHLTPVDVLSLADRFRFSPSQIENSVAIARQKVMGRSGSESGAVILVEDLFVGARAQAGHDLSTLAPKIDPHYTWDDIVLPNRQKQQLQDICNQLRYRQKVYATWGFEQKLSLGKGINVLFAGPPGTGKTMAADVIAHDLDLDLYKIDLSQVVSKYIGETEKNLSKIFTAATSSNAILLFDEADALFGKRSEVQDAHDRYANIEIGYLLQQMESYEGLAILTTNMRSNLDTAFSRRLRAIVDFPIPSNQHRRQIWQQIWPATLPKQIDEDALDLLAAELDIPGAHIRNIALAAAFLAAAEESPVTMLHILRSAEQEYLKMGRLLSVQKFQQYIQ